MPSKDSKKSQNEDSKLIKLQTDEVSKKAKKKNKQPLTLSKVVTYLILAVLSVVLIVGVIVPSFGSSRNSNSIEFGSYAGEKIEFKPGNYFYTQYQNQARQNTGNSESASYQIWRGAYESTVFHTAVEKMAKDAKILVAESTLNKAIIDSGAYSKDGKFDLSLYEKASLESKNSLKKQIETSIPTQIVLTDILSTLSSDNELEYIIGIGNESKAFDYVVLDASLYPDEATKQYALSNPANFSLIDISVITVDSEEAATQLKERIATNEITFSEAAIANSIDSFSAEGGKAGVYYLYELMGNFVNKEEVNNLFATPRGTVSDVFASSNGFSLYQVEQAPFLPDFDDTEVLADVRRYIQTSEPGITDSYIEEIGQEFIAKVNSGLSFQEASEEMDLKFATVPPTTVNVGSSSFLMGFNYTDTAGYLRALANDKESMKKLFSLEKGEISDFIKSNNASIIATVSEVTTMDTETSDYVAMIYPYLNQQQMQQDLIERVFMSDVFEDNFLPVYLDRIMGIANN